jgi:hypothetical protein
MQLSAPATICREKEKGVVMGKKLQPIRLAGALGAALLFAACGRAPEQGAETPQAGNSPGPFALFGPRTGSLPLSDTAPAGPVALAPSVRALPAAAALPFDYDAASDASDYEWIDQAGLLLDTIDDGPPDYAFGYDGIEPWAWQLDGGYRVFAEPIYGGYRYYYYGPGAGAPFLVRDPAYSYGYRDGRLVAVYGADGRWLDRRAALRQADDAARYYARARALNTAAAARNRHAVAATRWAAQQREATAPRRQWDEARRTQRAWQLYRARQTDDAARTRLVAERRNRVAEARRFAQWRETAAHGPRPPLPVRAARIEQMQQPAARRQAEVQRIASEHQQRALAARRERAFLTQRQVVQQRAQAVAVGQARAGQVYRQRVEAIQRQQARRAPVQALRAAERVQATARHQQRAQAMQAHAARAEQLQAVRAQRVEARPQPTTPRQPQGPERGGRHGRH